MMVSIRALKAAVAAGVMASAPLVAAPQASAVDLAISMEVSPYEIAYQGTSGILGLTGAPDVVSTGAAVAPGTSPSTTPIPGGYQIAWQGANHDLWTSGPNGPMDLGGALAPGTSPSLTGLPSGGYEAVYHGTDGGLWGTGSYYSGSFGVGMAPGTSPSILALSQPTPYGSGVQVLWQGANNHLWSTGPTGPIDLGVAMAPGTSPSVTTVTNSHGQLIGFQAAVQGSNGDLWWYDSAEFFTLNNTPIPGSEDMGIPMAAGTSPSIGEVVGGDEGTIAFQGRNGHLWTGGSFNGSTNSVAFDTGLPMMASTSPSLTVTKFDLPGRPLGGTTYYDGYVSATGVVSLYGFNLFGGANLRQSLGQVTAAGTSPSIVSALNWVDGGSVVGAAAPAPGAASSTAAPLKLPSRPTITPMLVPPVFSDTCTAVRAHLKQYAARHIKTVSCVTATEAPPPAPARTGPRTVTPDATGSSLCSNSDNTWEVTRTEECIQNGTINWEVTSTTTGAVLATYQFLLNQDILLAANSDLYVENDSITWAGAQGQTPPSGTVTLTAACGSPCRVISGGTTTFPLALGQTQSNIHTTYADSPGTQMPDMFNNSYVFALSQPGVALLGPVKWSPAQPIRCDDNTPGWSVAGCVVPSYTPTLVLPLSVYGTAALNVWLGETYLPGTPGLTAGTPLTRGNPAKTDANRAVTCNGFKALPPGNIYGVTGDSCDEYPFASSQQSGGALGIAGGNCWEVVSGQDPDDGAWVFTPLSKYTAKYPQVCLRGHVNSTLNSNVGRQALNPMYTNDRMMIGDPYTVQVTS
jgi:hypothetical protein